MGQIEGICALEAVLRLGKQGVEQRVPVPRENKHVANEVVRAKKALGGRNVFIISLHTVIVSTRII